MNATTTVLYTDLSRSTELLNEIGDEHYAARFTAHVSMVRAAVEANGGSIGKLLGDGVLATFPSAYGAIRASVAAMRQVDRAARSESSGFVMRAGLAVGEIVEAADDMYGATLVLARRLCDAARPGQILVADLVRALVASRGDCEFEPHDPMTLKGIADPVVAWSVPWSPLPQPRTLRVIVADDAPLIRAGVVRLLRDVGFIVVAEADDGPTLLDAVRRDPPDLVITDIRMPPTNTDEGLQAAATIRAEHPGVAVVVLSQHIEPAGAATLLATGDSGIGYLLKERVSDLDEFVEACRTVAAGGSVIDPDVGAALLEARAEDDVIASLTPREREALSLMARGHSNRAIAAELFVSAKTVETYVRNIFDKLGLVETTSGNRRVLAVIEWLGRPA